ncbi:26S proteasome subunit RPN7-domain-containing protein [Irpex lacteus]|nr:26S proteasome subunit RPN7-domain-containing protein [Irpex lacteus]
MGPYYKIVTSTNALPLDPPSSPPSKPPTPPPRLTRRPTLRSPKTRRESDIADALGRANHFRAVEAQKVVLEKTAGLGSRIDIVLRILGLGFSLAIISLFRRIWRRRRSAWLVEKGGDWDRRNRLKVYRGLHLLSIRQFKRGGELLLDALSTFTATELVSYNDFVAYTIISNVLTLNRPDLKKKLIGAPEVNQVLPELPTFADLIKNLYDSHYDKFFVALATLEQTFLLPSRLLSPHARFYVREMRILAYNQLLQSYRSLTLDSLARSFGVSIEFVDNELSRFIASSRLHCTIDKVNGVVETNRPAIKNAQYETVVRQGDVLLNSVQRLSKVLY